MIAITLNNLFAATIILVCLIALVLDIMAYVAATHSIEAPQNAEAELPTWCLPPKVNRELVEDFDLNEMPIAFLELLTLDKADGTTRPAQYLIEDGEITGVIIDED